jgi:hypothetical protein
MPKDKDRKRAVRARMLKTGEAYAAARRQLLSKERPAKDAPPLPDGDLAEIAGTSDAAVQAKTGRDWKGWLDVLDRAGAHRLPHRDIARLLRERHDVSSWWSQMVTVGYERLRGLREKGQRRGGGFDVNKSKTLPVPVATLYAAFGTRRRRRWLSGAEPTIRKATRESCLRMLWEDGRPVEAYFVEKGPSKSLVQVQHRELATKAEAERVRAEWGERLESLARHLAE